jgi:hypothetical protein
MSLLKFQMTCSNDLCNQTVLILVDPEVIDTPNVCPFCGAESSESSGDSTEE